MNFWESFIVTIVGATIGATIGGLFAYLIAKKRFSQDNLQDGIRCIELLKKVLLLINDKLGKLKEDLNSRTKYEEDEEKYYAIVADQYGKTVSTLDLFRKTWSHHQEKIWSLTQERICKQENKRSQFEIISDSFEVVSDRIESLQDYMKRIQTAYQKKPDTQDMRTFLDSQNNRIGDIITLIDAIIASYNSIIRCNYEKP